MFQFSIKQTMVFYDAFDTKKEGYAYCKLIDLFNLKNLLIFDKEVKSLHKQNTDLFTVLIIPFNWPNI